MADNNLQVCICEHWYPFPAQNQAVKTTRDCTEDRPNVRVIITSGMLINAALARVRWTSVQDTAKINSRTHMQIFQKNLLKQVTRRMKPAPKHFFSNKDRTDVVRGSWNKR